MAAHGQQERRAVALQAREHDLQSVKDRPLNKFDGKTDEERQRSKNAQIRRNEQEIATLKSRLA